MYKSILNEQAKKKLHKKLALRTKPFKYTLFKGTILCKKKLRCALKYLKLSWLSTGHCWSIE